MTDTAARRRKWRAENVKKRNEYRQRNYAARRYGAPGERRRWTPEEDALVMAHVMSDDQLAQRIKRSVLAVQVRRCDIKKGAKPKPNVRLLDALAWFARQR